VQDRSAKRLLLAGSLLLALALAEGAVRLLDASRGHSSRKHTAWYWLYEQDPFLGFRGRAGASASTPEETIEHNADGFRDRRSFEQVRAVRGRRLVVCVGESSTYGLSAGSSEATYPAVLEKELRRLSGDDRWVVFNAGMPAYTAHEVLELVKLRLLKLEPAIVVAMSLRNDHEYVVRHLEERQDYDFYPLRMAALSASFPNEWLMRSSLYGRIATRLRSRFVDDLGGRPPAQPHARPTPRGLKLYLDNLALLDALCRRSGVRLMLVDQPVNYERWDYDDGKRQSLEELRAALRSFCADSGVTLLSAHAQMDWRGLRMEDDVHLGAAGYARLAGLLAPQILAAGAP
jgi:lysophospholipase L1-like esterase